MERKLQTENGCPKEIDLEGWLLYGDKCETIPEDIVVTYRTLRAAMAAITNSIKEGNHNERPEQHHV